MDGLERQLWRHGVHRWKAARHRREARILPYALAVAAGLFLTFSVLVGFHRPTGRLQPQLPGTVEQQQTVPDTGSDPALERIETAGSEEDGTRASRSTPRGDGPSTPVQLGRLAPAPRSPTDASSPAAAGATPAQPLIATGTPQTICPPPLPPTGQPTHGKPDKTKPPRPKVQQVGN